MPHHMTHHLSAAHSAHSMSAAHHSAIHHIAHPFLALTTSIFGSLPGESGKKHMFPLPKDSKKDVAFFKEIIDAGKYKAVIDRCYPFDQIIDAYRYVETGEKTGNVVITLPKS